MCCCVNLLVSDTFGVKTEPDVGSKPAMPQQFSAPALERIPHRHSGSIFRLGGGHEPVNLMNKDLTQPRMIRLYTMKRSDHGSHGEHEVLLGLLLCKRLAGQGRAADVQEPLAVGLGLGSVRLKITATCTVTRSSDSDMGDLKG